MIESLKQCKQNNRTARNLIIADTSLRGSHWQTLRADQLTLQTVDLRDANLTAINWRNCQLHDVRLANTVLQGAVLRLCTLKEVSAVHSDFFQAKIEHCLAAGCRFSEANFSEASLLDSDFSRTDLQRANLAGVFASGVDFRGADLTQANLTAADFSDVDLRGANLTGAKLKETNLQGADLRGAIMDQSNNNTPSSAAEFSPQLQELVNSMGPVVAHLLEEAGDMEVFDSDKQADLLKQLQQMTTAPGETSSTHYNTVINQVLKRAADTGVKPLLDALGQEQAEPSQAVLTLLENLAGDFQLGDKATAQDLLKQLMKMGKGPAVEH